MATDVKKVIELVKEEIGKGIPEGAEAESIMQDPDGNIQLKLGIKCHREIVTEIGFFAAPEIPIDVVAAMASMTQLAKGQSVMAASLIKPEAIEEALSDDGKVDDENMVAVNAAVLMLKECLRRYSVVYQERNRKLREEMENKEKEQQN
ncbi:MAG: hypothetical protein ACOX71_04880 [Lachnospiraceae bacterium]|jgi:hypothetical protein